MSDQVKFGGLIDDGERQKRQAPKLHSRQYYTGYGEGFRSPDGIVGPMTLGAARGALGAIPTMLDAGLRSMAGTPFMDTIDHNAGLFDAYWRRNPSYASGMIGGYGAIAKMLSPAAALGNTGATYPPRFGRTYER